MCASLPSSSLSVPVLSPLASTALIKDKRFERLRVFLSDQWDLNAETREVIGHDGQRYPKFSFNEPILEEWQSRGCLKLDGCIDLKREIYKVLKNTELSERIWSSCKEFLLSLNDSHFSNKLLSWLRENIIALPCPIHAKQILEKRPDFKGVPVVSMNFSSAFKCLGHDHESRKPNGSIAIITSSSAGGEFSVAMATRSYLKNLGFRVKVIDNDTAFISEDNSYKFFGFSQAELYKFLNQQSNDHKGDHKLGTAGNNLFDFIRSNEYSVLSKMLTQSGSHRRKFDLVMDTCHAFPQKMSVSISLNQPWVMVSCDAIIGSYLALYAKSVIGSPIRMCITHSGGVDGESEERLSPIDQKEIIFNLGHPTFVEKPTSDGEVLTVRRRLKLPTDNKIVMIAVGKNGIGASASKYMSILNSRPDISEKITIVVFCGRNQILLKESVEMQKANRNPKVEYRILAEVSVRVVAQYYRARPHLIIGKAGGAVVSELVRANVFGLLFSNPTIFFEKANLEYAKSLGLGFQMVDHSYVNPDPDEFIKSLNLLLSSTPPKVDVVNWKERLRLLLKGFNLTHPPTIEVLKRRAFIQNYY